MKLERVKTKSLRALIYEQLKEKIMSGEIKPGEELSLRMLADKLGVSLMPVREAVWQLESDKILIVRNNRGIKVNTLTSAEMNEALHLRYVLEAEAATLSCKRRKSDEIVSDLENILVQMEDKECSPREFLELNYDFHFTLYSCAESPMLIDLIEKLWARITPYKFIHITSREDLSITPAKSFHREMLNFFIKRDAKSLTAVLYEDIHNPASGLITQMEDETDNE